MTKHKKTGKGLVLRPCHICSEIVNFIKWPEESLKRRKNIYHWANADGSHHIHGIKELTPEQKHLNEIMNN